MRDYVWAVAFLASMAVIPAECLAQSEAAEALIQEAREAHSDGDLPKALKIVNRAIAADPSYSRAHFLRFVVLTDAGQAEKAESALRAALANAASEEDRARLKNAAERYQSQGSKPNAKSSALAQEAAAALSSGRRFLAARKFREAFRADPAQGQFGVQAAEQFAALGEVLEAARLYRAVQGGECSSNSKLGAKGGLLALGSQLRGLYDKGLVTAKAALRTKDYQAAKSGASSAILARPEDSEAQFLLARAEAGLGKFAESARALGAASAKGFADRKGLLEAPEFFAAVRDPEFLSAVRDCFGLRLVEELKAKALSPGAIERAKRLRDFHYLDTKVYACGGKDFEVARFKHAKTGLVFHLVRGGTYKRGRESGKSDQKPVRNVTIEPFLICATECTQEAWGKVMGTAPSHFKGAQRPVERVSWADVQTFGQKAGLRLPSEAEWEYASRAGTTTEFCFGDSGRLWDYGVFEKTETQLVGKKLPNAFGLHDMYGNVWEWCQDAYVGSYSGAPTDGSARDTPGASKRVRRGGGWRNDMSNSANRGWSEPATRFRSLGFRPARSLP